MGNIEGGEGRGKKKNGSVVITSLSHVGRCDFCRTGGEVGFVCIASPQQGDLKLSDLPSGQDAGGGTLTRDRRVPSDLKADSLSTEEKNNILDEEEMFLDLHL
ncbi:hypothetical protein PoB_007307400 [Plakobranchus ocellatus]|uniref:Uncharacterized protein n=1 Tax=Plakobranchus ocellatus TaxID=259542 RepID=A0AAV4DQT3_9GAST|nr:hypothetical protein PoB_007307400 [Plakobranchus ocellatus]